ncbi:hypothetical protein [Streptomyces sp. NPDC048295]|uniref:hypothetical protein n=1 Tax=Streptomyces sp. NPDC048295 TaxID=3154617 RepID=UPI00341572F1
MTCAENEIVRIGPQQFHETNGVEDRRVVGEEACAYVRAGSFAAGARFVQAVSELPAPPHAGP